MYKNKFIKFSLKKRIEILCKINLNIFYKEFFFNLDNLNYHNLKIKLIEAVYKNSFKEFCYKKLIKKM